MSEINFQSGERVFLKLRKHWIILLRDTIGTIIVGILPLIAVLAIAVVGIIPSTALAYTPIFVFVMLAWLLVIWMALVALWTDYYLDMWIVTDRRVISIDQMGLFRRRITSWTLDHVQEVSVETSNILETLLNYGTIQIETAGPDDEHATVEGIPHPEKIRAAIIDQVAMVKKLEAENKSQEKLLHSISHEAKGYLTKDAAALSSIADGSVGAVSEGAKAVATTALSEARRGVDTMMNILEGSDLKRGSMRIRKKKFDMAEAARAIVDEIKPSAEKKGISLEAIIDSGEYTIAGDEGKLRRLVMRNLIDNAVRYTKEGGVRVMLAHHNDAVVFSVKDTGVGIGKEDMQRLFTPGGKGEHADEVNPESTGYGLYTAKEIVEAHQGRIWVESDGEGKGAQFIVELPVA